MACTIKISNQTQITVSVQIHAHDMQNTRRGIRKVLIYIALSAGGFAWSTAFGTTLSRIVSKLQGAPPSSHKYLLHPLTSINTQVSFTSISYTLSQVSYTSTYTLSVRPSHPLTSTSISHKYLLHPLTLSIGETTSQQAGHVLESPFAIRCRPC